MSNSAAGNGGGGGQQQPAPKMSQRAQYAAQKELEEYRRMGLAPLERDVRSGKEINPNIPSMISDAPFYLQAGGSTLDHQRQAKEVSDTEAMKGSANKTVVVGQAKRFRPGACKNCGAMGHKEKDCTEPKRKVGAVHSNAKIAQDTKLVDESGIKNKTYQQKRDVWADVSAEHYQKVWDNFEKEDVLADKRLKLEGGGGGGGGGTVSTTAAGTEKEAGLFAAKSGDNVVSLRDVADVPKYLQNLGNDNVFFDPKSRSMRTNPHAAGGGGGGSGEGDAAAAAANMASYKGDNSMYEESKEYKEALEMQYFLQTHPEVRNGFLPTENQRLFREWKAKRELEETRKERELAALYGGGDGNAENKAVATGQDAAAAVASSATTEAPSGPTFAAPTAPTTTATTKKLGHMEQQHAELLGHTSIFGSYFDREKGLWGYKCCKQVGEKNVECTVKKSE